MLFLTIEGPQRIPGTTILWFANPTCVLKPEVDAEASRRISDYVDWFKPGQW